MKHCYCLLSALTHVFILNIYCESRKGGRTKAMVQSLSTGPMSADVRKEILDKGTRTQAKNTSIKIRAYVN